MLLQYSGGAPEGDKLALHLRLMCYTGPMNTNAMTTSATAQATRDVITWTQ